MSRIHRNRSDDGERIVFNHRGNLTGENPDTNPQIFAVQADGTALRQLTHASGGLVGSPVLSGDGAKIAFTVFAQSWRIQTLQWDGSGLVDLANGENRPSITDDGETMTGLAQVTFRTRITGAPVQRVTADPAYESIDPDISGDASRVVYASAADPLGSNPDHNHEIFLYDVSTATRRQLTITASGWSGLPRISRDGAWVYFLSSAPSFEPNRDHHVEPYRLFLATGIVERMGGTRGAGAEASPYDAISVDHAVTRAVFTGYGNWNDQNPDLGGDVYLVDWAAPATIRVGRSAPTLIAWDPEPKPVRYDTIRGDVANLSPGPLGGVDLGAVACIEDESPDTDTTGFEDPIQPPPGHVFFYLYRGTQGLAEGPGSWGQGSSGGERTPDTGDCSP